MLTLKNFTLSYSLARSSMASFICLHGSDHGVQKWATTSPLKDPKSSRSFAAFNSSTPAMMVLDDLYLLFRDHLPTAYSMSTCRITPRACTSFVQGAVVVVSTKIARSGDLGIRATCKYSISISSKNRPHLRRIQDWKEDGAKSIARKIFSHAPKR